MEITQKVIKEAILNICLWHVFVANSPKMWLLFPKRIFAHAEPAFSPRWSKDMLWLLCLLRESMDQILTFQKETQQATSLLKTFTGRQPELWSAKLVLTAESLSRDELRQRLSFIGGNWVSSLWCEKESIDTAIRHQLTMQLFHTALKPPPFSHKQEKGWPPAPTKTWMTRMQDWVQRVPDAGNEHSLLAGRVPATKPNVHEVVNFCLRFRLKNCSNEGEESSFGRDCRIVWNLDLQWKKKETAERFVWQKPKGKEKERQHLHLACDFLLGFQPAPLLFGQSVSIENLADDFPQMTKTQRSWGQSMSCTKQQMSSVRFLFISRTALVVCAISGQNCSERFVLSICFPGFAVCGCCDVPHKICCLFSPFSSCPFIWKIFLWFFTRHWLDVAWLPGDVP